MTDEKPIRGIFSTFKQKQYVTDDELHMLNMVANFLSDAAEVGDERGDTGIITLWNEFGDFVDRCEAPGEHGMERDAP